MFASQNKQLYCNPQVKRLVVNLGIKYALLQKMCNKTATVQNVMKPTPPPHKHQSIIYLGRDILMVGFILSLSNPPIAKRTTCNCGNAITDKFLILQLLGVFKTGQICNHFCSFGNKVVVIWLN